MNIKKKIICIAAMFPFTVNSHEVVADIVNFISLAILFHPKWESYMAVILYLMIKKRFGISYESFFFLPTFLLTFIIGFGSMKYLSESLMFQVKSMCSKNLFYPS
jgi:hypothetical protein